MQKEYCDWNYCFMDNKYSVIPNKSIDTPTTLFKYYALSNNSVNALTNLYLYGSHPQQLNDPFDCNKNLIDFSEWKIPEEQCEEHLEEIYSYDKISINRFKQEYFYKTMYGKVGIISLSSSKDNASMWAHYTDYKGFCIEFDTNKLGFKYYGPFPINYTDEIHKIDISSIGGFLALLIQSNVKLKCWEYEKEWRLLALGPDDVNLQYFGPDANLYQFSDDCKREFHYSLSAIKSVYLGAKFFDNCKTLSLNDYELDVHYCNKEALGCKIMEFLSNPKLCFIKIFYANVKYLLNSMEFIEIKIIKINDTRFRIIECANQE